MDGKTDAWGERPEDVLLCTHQEESGHCSLPYGHTGEHALPREPAHRAPRHEPCVTDAGGNCTRWSHDHAESDAGCGHPNHGNRDHDCKPFVSAEDRGHVCGAEFPGPCGTTIRCGRPDGHPDRIVDGVGHADTGVIVAAPRGLSPAWCLCGLVNDLGDGTCGNCGLPIMTDDDDPCARTTEETR